MALNIEGIAAGNNTATAIKAAYEPLNNKTDRYEYCVIDFIQGILEVAGIEDTPTFERSMLINEEEKTNMVLSAGNVIDRTTILEKLPWIMNDEIDTIKARLAEEELSRYDGTAEGITEGTADGGENNA